MTERELRLWMLEETIEDSWWLSVDGQNSEAPVTLSKAADYTAANADKEILVLHASQAEVKNPPWIPLEPSPVMTPQERADFRLPKSWLGRGLQLGLLVVVVAGLVYYFMPEPVVDESQQPPKVLVSREAMIKKLAVVEELGATAEPVIDATIARSGRIFFITNHNTQAWPSITIRLEDGYTCEWTQRVEPGITMQIPFRFFTRDGKALADGDVNLSRIVLEVPGLRKWEKNF
ncbi:hypothetical protein H5P28_16210 [Ruficoccus amylovorans]|uniref:Uncharacterized protein n=1 Tax=Ruficoccus amylovorans TaxID=1804625 RepID=A0A842HKZ3_9BACT|nr:hypothetical protein [Ruficoccus amylovorans]MBC2595811.1 hypothetical protein [Ruficoccus amylovorans]